jgi:hypothetical protein
VKATHRTTATTVPANSDRQEPRSAFGANRNSSRIARAITVIPTGHRATDQMPRSSSLHPAPVGIARPAPSAIPPATNTSPTVTASTNAIA